MRKLFTDLGVIGRDVFADAASKAAEVARPDEEALANADAPAPDNEFHDDIPAALKKKNIDEANAKKEEAKAELKTRADAAQDPNSSKTPAEALKDAQGALAAKIPQKHKDLAKEHTDKTKDYLKEKFVSIRRLRRRSCFSHSFGGGDREGEEKQDRIHFLSRLFPCRSTSYFEFVLL